MKPHYVPQTGFGNIPHGYVTTTPMPDPVGERESQMRDDEDAIHEALDSFTRRIEELEAQLAQRTRDLEAANERLRNAEPRDCEQCWEDGYKEAEQRSTALLGKIRALKRYEPHEPFMVEPDEWVKWADLQRAITEE